MKKKKKKEEKEPFAYHKGNMCVRLSEFEKKIIFIPFLYSRPEKSPISFLRPRPHLHIATFVELIMIALLIPFIMMDLISIS